MNKKQESILNKLYYVLLVIVLIIAIIVRFWGLGEKSLWIDEYWSYVFSSQKTFLDSFIYMLYDLSPSTYYIILYVWIKLFGNSEIILRLPSFFAGVASIIIIYFSTKKMFNKQIAIGTAILASFSPVFLYYSQEARSYSLLILFSIIAFNVWSQIIKKNK